MERQPRYGVAALLQRASLAVDFASELSRTDQQSLTPAVNAQRRAWTINGDFVALQPNGVARYAREVTLAIDALVAEKHPLAAGLDIELLAPHEPREPLRLQKIPIRIIPEFKYPRLPQVWVQAQLPQHVAGGLLSFCNLAPMLNRKHIVCIHDLHTRLMPNSYGRLFRWVHRVVLPILGRRAKFITTVSTSSREHLIRFGVAPAEKIVVTYNGSDHTACWRPEKSNLKPKPARPFVLCLGQNQEYKNTKMALRLAQSLDEMGLDICIAGNINEKTLRADTREDPRNLRLLGRIDDDDLASMMSKALCFLFPSRIEGFGLPVIEAMALGCPVVASSAPCLPEVCGNAALLVDPDDPAGWIEAVRDLQTDQRLRRRMILRGYARARIYSWRNIAEVYLQLMAQVDEATLPHSQMRNCDRIRLDATRRSNRKIRPKKSRIVLSGRQG
ncbi:MAG: glycosyltransferase family 1 protein [Pseudorhodoplanes sp.]|nr:glycosyltransferase family 1 protein [Pseudorhodoplanes sp.]